jgi:hypothetical protein
MQNWSLKTGEKRSVMGSKCRCIILPSVENCWNYVFIIIISGVRLGALGTAATTGLLYQLQMIHRRKPAPVPLCPPQIPHDLTQARTRAAAVGSRRLTALAMARPLLKLTVEHVLNVESNSNPRNTALGMYNTELWLECVIQTTLLNTMLKKCQRKVFIYLNGAASIKFHLAGGNMNVVKGIKYGVHVILQEFLKNLENTCEAC